LDANRPIDPRSGQIEPQVANPEIVSSTGAGWVRLNFVLGPWSGPDDDRLCEGRTWAEAYEHIVSGFRSHGLQIYGLIGAEAMPDSPGDRFRSPPQSGTADDEWLDRYVEHFVRIVEMFHLDLPIVESFNEPDDWHGQQSSWVHPGWFAIMLQRIHAAVRSRPELERVRLVSGPLQGLESNRNAAAHYLQRTYHAGKEWFGWGQPGRPVPFDGVGYHIYVKSDFDPRLRERERAIRTLCRRYLGAMHQVIRRQEGRDRPLFVSEIGWNSRVEPREYQLREEFQARCLRAGLETVCADPLVELAVWFCVRDFRTPAREMRFGLYRASDMGPGTRKPAFHTFQAFCEGTIEEEEEEPRYTNQQVINAFYGAAIQLGLANRWSLLTKAGLDLRELAGNRAGPYEGLSIDQLPNLTTKERAVIKAKLGAQVRAIGLPAVEGAATVPDGGDSPDDLVAFDLTLALQEQVLQELARQQDLLQRLLDKLAQQDGLEDRPAPQLWRVGLVCLLSALMVAIASILVAQILFS
jgi:hypothetical protein